MAFLRFRRGFTLIELLVGMVIAGLLFSMAFSWYSNSIMKAHRSDALMALAQDQIILERCYAEHFSYKTSCSLLPNYPHPSAQGFYSIEIKNQDEQHYTLEARSSGSQANDKECALFRVTQTQHKMAMSSAGVESLQCWGV